MTLSAVTEEGTNFRIVYLPIDSQLWPVLSAAQVCNTVLIAAKAYYVLIQATSITSVYGWLKITEYLSAEK